jgi:hypothetical protein
MTAMQDAVWACHFEGTLSRNTVPVAIEQGRESPVLMSMIQHDSKQSQSVSLDHRVPGTQTHPDTIFVPFVPIEEKGGRNALKAWAL